MHSSPLREIFAQLHTSNKQEPITTKRGPTRSKWSTPRARNVEEPDMVQHYWQVCTWSSRKCKKDEREKEKNSKRECQACNLRQQRSAKEEENSTGSSISGCVGGSLVRRRMDRGRGRRMGNFVRWVAEARHNSGRQRGEWERGRSGVVAVG